MTKFKQEFFQYRKMSIIAGQEFEGNKWTKVDRHAIAILLTGAGDNAKKILGRVDASGSPVASKIGVVRRCPEESGPLPVVHPNRTAPITGRLMDISPGAVKALEKAGADRQAKTVQLENRRPIPREVVTDAHQPRATPEAPKEDKPAPLDSVTTDGETYIRRIQELAQIAFDQAEGVQGLIKSIQELMAPFPLNRPGFDLQQFREDLDLTQAGMGRLRSFLNRYLPER